MTNYEFTICHFISHSFSLPEIWQIDRALGRRPAGVCHNSLGHGPTSVLKMYPRRPFWMWLSQRALPNPGELSELAQIFNSTNLAGPLSKCDLSISNQIVCSDNQLPLHHLVLCRGGHSHCGLCTTNEKGSVFHRWHVSSKIYKFEENPCLGCENRCDLHVWSTILGKR